MRQIDLWIDYNLITLLVTVINIARCWDWHQANRRILPRLAGRDAALCRVNITIVRLFIGMNAAVFGLGLYLVQVARGIDRAASAAHPARVAPFVVNGTAAFACIWVGVALGAWWFRRAMERIQRMPATQQLHALRRDEQRLEGD